MRQFRCAHEQELARCCYRLANHRFGHKDLVWIANQKLRDHFWNVKRIGSSGMLTSHLAAAFNQVECLIQIIESHHVRYHHHHCYCLASAARVPYVWALTILPRFGFRSNHSFWFWPATSLAEYHYIMHAPKARWNASNSCWTKSQLPLACPIARA